jgi:probable F420-dependent oxidoreductase
MKISVSLPNNWGVEDVQAIFKLADRAEALGFDSVWVAEHVFNVSYVYNRIGNRPYYEPLTILSYIAARTEKVGLGTSVLVLPYHNPIRLAKVAATLDVMSSGRLRLGVGVGVIEQELEAMGSAFSERGAITNEAIAVMKELWTQEDPSFDGRYSKFSGMKFSPKPLQKPHIPIVIGGTSRAAIRRAARMGNGWHPTPLSPEELGQGMGYLKERAQAAGRDASEIPVSIRLDMGQPRAVSTRPQATANASRYTLGGEPEEIVHNMRAFESLGVDEIVVSDTTGDPDHTLASMEMLAQGVLPAFQ